MPEVMAEEAACFVQSKCRVAALILFLFAVYRIPIILCVHSPPPLDIPSFVSCFFLGGGAY